MTGSADFASRRARVLESLAGLEADAMLVTDLVNIHYLTGFTGSNATLAISTAGTALMVTDGRYADQAAAQCPDLELAITRVTDETAWTRLAENAESVAVEADHLSLARWDAIERAGTDARVVRTSGVVEAQRRIKDAIELTAVDNACAMICEAFAALLPEIRVGLTERQIRQRLEWLIFEAGADAVGFETIVATGPNSAVPHHSPTDRPVQRGDLLKIDAGVRHCGYHSDMTRTFVVGAEPTQHQLDLHAAVKEAAAAARESVTGGAAASAVDEVARRVLSAHDLAEAFTHGLGHGVGLQIHEAPWLNALSTDTIGVGDVLTIEPGVYLPGFGGVRIEDTLAVGADGGRSLTTTDRELLRLA